MVIIKPTCLFVHQYTGKLPAKRGSTLPVDVKRDLIKDLYGGIGEKMFGVTPDRMHRMIDQIMSDGDVEKEWNFIQKGNVEKLLKLMNQIKQHAGPGDEIEMEDFQNLWKSVADGIIKTKQAHKEIDQKSWDFMEDHLMKFVDDFSEKLSGRSGQALPGSERKQLQGGGLLAQVIEDADELHYIMAGLNKLGFVIESQVIVTMAKVRGTELEEVLKAGDGVRGDEPEAKDLKRMTDIEDKANGDVNKMVQLATQMAGSIRNKDKAIRRGKAAKIVITDPKVASKISKIFFDAAKRCKD